MKDYYGEIDILSLVVEVDKDHYKPDIVYEFSNGRKFESTDRATSGIYE